MLVHLSLVEVMYRDFAIFDAIKWIILSESKNSLEPRLFDRFEASKN